MSNTKITGGKNQFLSLLLPNRKSESATSSCTLLSVCSMTKFPTLFVLAISFLERRSTPLFFLDCIFPFVVAVAVLQHLLSLAAAAAASPITLSPFSSSSPSAPTPIPSTTFFSLFPSDVVVVVPPPSPPPLLFITPLSAVAAAGLGYSFPYMPPHEWTR